VAVVVVHVLPANMGSNTTILAMADMAGFLDAAVLGKRQWRLRGSFSQQDVGSNTTILAMAGCKNVLFGFFDIFVFNPHVKSI